MTNSVSAFPIKSCFLYYISSILIYIKLIDFPNFAATQPHLSFTVILNPDNTCPVGSLRVLGYTPAQVARIFSGESLLLNGFAIALGLLAGVGLAHLLAYAYNTGLYRFPAVIYPVRFLLTAALMAVFVGLAQLIIYGTIRRMDWLEVLKVKE